MLLIYMIRECSLYMESGLGKNCGEGDAKRLQVVAKQFHTKFWKSKESIKGFITYQLLKKYLTCQLYTNFRI